MYIRDDNEECTIDGVRYDKESRQILFDSLEIQSTTGKYNEDEI